MAAHGLSEERAHQTIRRMTMSRRIPTEEVALAVINANDFLHPTPKLP